VIPIALVVMAAPNLAASGSCPGSPADIFGHNVKRERTKTQSAVATDAVHGYMAVCISSGMH